MSPAKSLFLILFLVFCNNVESSSLLERSYEYVMNLGKNLAPSFMSMVDCFGEQDPWTCAKEKAGKILDGWDEEVQKQRRSWQEAADAEVASSGRSLEEMPSKIGREVEDSLNSIANLVQHGMARALARKNHEGGGIDSITISTGGGEKKKMKKKKQKPAKIHLINPVVMPMKQMQEKGREFPQGKVQSWVIGDVEEKEKEGVVEEEEKRVESYRRGRGLMSDLWGVGEKALDAVAEHAIESENEENGVVDRSSFEEQRGKKKKKKKAILKLLILGAVLKAKIGTLLQILSFKLQVKFFIVAVLGLAINLARLWIDLKNKHQQQPQKVIYYEHAQHQHHYDHEEDSHGWGPWSRSMEPEEPEAEIEVDQNSPYRAHARNQAYQRPIITRV